MRGSRLRQKSAAGPPRSCTRKEKDPCRSNSDSHVPPRTPFFHFSSILFTPLAGPTTVLTLETLSGCSWYGSVVNLGPGEGVRRCKHFFTLRALRPFESYGDLDQSADVIVSLGKKSRDAKISVKVLTFQFSTRDGISWIIFQRRELRDRPSVQHNAPILVAFHISRCYFHLPLWCLGLASRIDSRIKSFLIQYSSCIEIWWSHSIQPAMFLFFSTEKKFAVFFQTRIANSIFRCDNLSSRSHRKNLRSSGIVCAGSGLWWIIMSVSVPVGGRSGWFSHAHEARPQSREQPDRAARKNSKLRTTGNRA